jgi:HSP20 family protein
MQLVRWNPWMDTMRFGNRMNRFFDGNLFSFAPSKADHALCSWNPQVDIFESDDAYVIKAELPGIDKNNIIVDLKGRVLTLKGERSQDNEVKEDKFFRRERVFGKFCRAFTLPEHVAANTVKADYKDGVLEITVPKPEEQKPKQITIH